MKMLSKIKFRLESQCSLLTAIVFCLVSILVLLLIPGTRRGPFGFGISDSKRTFQTENGDISISYPENWVLVKTPQGNHGDDEVIAVILVSGKQLANVTIARNSSIGGSHNGLVSWGQARARRYTEVDFLSLEEGNQVNPYGYISEYVWINSGLFRTTCRCQDIYLLNDGTGYDFSFCASEKDWQELKDSFTQMQLSISSYGE